MSAPLREVVETFETAGVTHVVGLPDNLSAPVFDACVASSIHVVTVTREGEAFAVAAGLWMGGARPLVMIQNTGLLESGDAARGTVTRMGVPVVLLVTVRGFASLSKVNGAVDRDTLVRADIDSVALLTEPTLDAWGIPVVRGGDQLSSAIELGLAEAERRQGPVAVLMRRAVNQ